VIELDIVDYRTYWKARWRSPLDTTERRRGRNQRDQRVRGALDSHGRGIEVTQSRYPADRYALHVLFDVEGADPQPGQAEGGQP
jgi:hypothetical protein